MNKYKKLTRNTGIFFLGESLTKIAAFFMLRYYTSVFSLSEYGIVDLIVTTAVFLEPLITLGINQGVFRFSMDRDVDHSKVLTIGITLAFAGNFILLILMHAINLDQEFWEYRTLIWLICFATSLRAIVANYCRGIERSKLYAASGVIHSVLQIGSAITLISGFHLLIKGYIYATVFSSLTTTLILLIAMRKEFHFKWKIDTALLRRMIIYSVPLIAQTVGWLVMSSIDKYVILAQLTTADNGMFAAAGKVPLLIASVSSIFMRAWQVSSVAEADSEDKDAFYSKIFHLTHIALALFSMVVLLLIRPIYSILVGATFEGCWQYTPFLIVSAIFSCFAGFMETNYVAMKKTIGAVYTTSAAAVINLVLNIVLTKQFGINGTAFATMLSYVIFWLLIMLNTRKFVRIRINYPKFILTYLLVLAQAFIIANGQSLYLVQAALLGLVVVLNFKDIVVVFRKVSRQLLGMRKRDE